MYYSNVKKRGFKVKAIVTLVAMCITILVPSMGVMAAPSKTPSLKDVFSAKYYADQNPDVKAAFGENEALLYQHFIQYGIKEGRVVSPLLDLRAYRAGNPDLDAAFGDNWEAYIRHYLRYGIYENANGQRSSAGIKFNPVAYAAAYPDVKAVYGNDVLAIAEHYMEYGVSEGRTVGTSAARSSSGSSSSSKSSSSKSSSSSSKSSSAVANTPASSTPVQPTEHKADFASHTKESFDNDGNCKEKDCKYTLNQFKEDCAKTEAHQKVYTPQICDICGANGTKSIEQCTQKDGHSSATKDNACSECGYVGEAVSD